MAPELWTPEEAAKQLRTTCGTLQWWRATGRGPKYVKVGRKVFYRPPDLETFIVVHVPAEVG